MVADRDERRLLYLCLQSTAVAQASQRHVQEIVHGLRAGGWIATLVDPPAPQGGLLRRLPGLVAAVGRGILELRRHRVVYIRAHPLALPVIVASRLLRRAVITEVNGPFHDIVVVHPKARPLLQILDAASLASVRLSHALVVPTRGLGEWLGARGVLTPWRVIPSGANLEHFADDLGRPSSTVNTPFVVFVGSLSPWQGLELMASATESPEWPRGVELLVVGSPVAGISASTLPNGDRIRYLGQQPHEEAARLLSAATVSLSLKSLEGVQAECGQAPVKVYESLAAGTPVIGTQLHGQAEIIKGSGCGCLVPPDPTAVARTVAAYLCDPDRVNLEGERGRRWIAEGHTWQHRVDATQQLLTEVKFRQSRDAQASSLRPRQAPPEPRLPDRPHIAVCIPTLARPDGLLRLLRSLEHLEFPSIEPECVTIVVADNDPAGSAGALLADHTGRWPVRVVHEPNPGVAQARNACQGAALDSDVDAVAFLDDDESVSVTWLDELLRVQRGTFAHVVAGPVEPVLEEPAVGWLRDGRFYDRPRTETGTELATNLLPRSQTKWLWQRMHGSRPGPIVATNNALVDADLARSTAGFDARLGLTGGSDREYFMRLAHLGARMVWADEAVVYDHVPTARQRPGWLLQRSFRYGNNAALLQRLTEAPLRERVDLAMFSLVSLAGGSAIALGRLAANRTRFLEGARVAARGLGGLAGLLGYQYREYRR